MQLSSDTSEITVPVQVTIPANQTSVNFDLNAVDDFFVDGPIGVSISVIELPSPPLRPDSSFGTSGVVNTTLRHNTFPRIIEMLQQPDGKILAFGRDPVDNDSVNLLRLNSDGTADSTFGVGGLVKTTFSGTTALAQGIELMSDGRIVVAALSSGVGTALFARYQADGQLDTTFDTDGLASVNFGTNTNFDAFSVNADGSMWATSHVTAPTTGLVLAKINANGSLASTTTFNFGGTPGAQDERVRLIARQADGKLVLAGFEVNSADLMVVRVDASGNLDSSFGGDGVQSVPFAVAVTQITPHDLKILADGRILVAGTTATSSGNNGLFAVRFQADGGLDTSFSGDGILDSFPGFSDTTANSIELLSDGKFLLGGSANFRDRALFMFNEDGTAVTQFSTDGVEVLSPLPELFEEIFSTELQPDGKLLAYTGYAFDFHVERYLLPRLASASINVTDNDVAGFTITQSGGTTSVNESGTTDTFTVVLTAQPTSNVVITVTSGDTTEATVSPATLTFTTANWNVAQTVTVTGVDDFLDDGDLTSFVTLSIDDAISDNAFDPVADQTVSVTTIDNDAAGFTVTQTGGTTSVNENGTTDTFDVVLTAQPLSNVVVTVSSGDTGEATVNVTTLTFTSANWNLAQTVTVTGVDDFFDDGNQTTTVTLSIDDANSDNTFDPVFDQTVSVTTVDDDMVGFTVTQSGGTTSVSEVGSTDSITVVLNAQPLTDVVITVASNDTGEATVSPTTLTFTTSNWNTPQVVTVTAVDDNIVDATQTSTLTFSVSDASSDDAFDPLADQTVTVTTDDDDSGIFSVGDASATEGIGVTFTITLSKAADVTTSVTFTTSNGSATTGDSDYTAISAQTVTFLAGETSQTVTVNTTGDSKVEANETFTVTLGGLVSGGRNVSISGTNGSATGTITNDDSAVFSIANASASEGNGVTFTITLSNAVDVDTSVTATTSNGSAFAGSDYTAVSGQTVTFAAGTTSQTFTVNTINDAAIELDETFTATLGGLNANGRSVLISGSNGAATGTIFDNDFSVTVSVAPGSVSEDGVANLVYTFARVGTTTNPLTVQFSVSGSAAFGSDYSQSGAAAFDGSTGSVVIPAGNATATVTIDPTADVTVEANESVTLTVSSDAAYQVGSPSAATGTITNDDSAVFSIANASATEGLGVTFTITLSNPVDVATSVTVTSSNGTATISDSDYTAVTAQTVSFSAGVTSQSFTVNTTADPKVEGDETFTATLGGLNAGGRSVTISGANAAATGTILNDDSAVFSISDSSASEGNGVTFTITLSNPVDVATSVTVSTSDGSATLVDIDYTAVTSQVVSFAAGQTSRTITANTTADSKVESDETFTATLVGLNAAGRSVSLSGTNAAATGTILNDDGAVFSISDSSASEGNGVTFTITLSNAVDVATSVTVTTSDGSATLSDNDYTAVTAQTVSFGAGVTSRTITVITTADSKVEGDETFTATLGGLNAGGRSVSISGTNGTATGTIANDDSAEFSISDASATEGSGVTFTITLSNPVDSATSVTLTTSDGTATTADSDYSAIVLQTVAFLAGETSQTVTVNTTTDNQVEADETFAATLGGLNDGGRSVTISGTNGTATGTITNDDSADFRIADSSAIEGDGVVFTITLSNPIDVETSVTLTTIDGSATLADNDYTAAMSQTVTFAAGQTTQTVTVDTTADMQVEGDESFTAMLGDLSDGGRSVSISGASGSATGTIFNDDGAIFSISDAVDVEGNGITFTITLSQPVDVETSVTVTTSDGTATLSNGDYTGVTMQTVVFAAGVTSQTITIDSTADDTVEPDETFTATLGDLIDGSRAVSISGFSGSATGTILNDDQAIFSLADSAMDEGGAITFTITLSNPVDADTSVTFTTSDGSAMLSDNDYTAVTQTILFLAGETSHTITVDTTADNTVEADETIVAALSGLDDGGRNVVLSATDRSAIGTITNDDAAVFSINGATVVEGAGVTFTVTLSNRVDVATSVTVSTSNGTATTADNDYSPLNSQILTFAAGQTSRTVTVNTTNDSQVEGTETFLATLGGLNAGGRNVTISGTNGSATGTITDNDSAEFRIANASATEGNGVTFTITLSNPVDVATSVTLTTSDGSATLADGDYSAIVGQTVTFAAGVTSRTVTVNTTADNKVEADETLLATLSGLGNAGRSVTISATNGSATGTILNDDSAVFRIANVSAVEGVGLNFTVTLSNPVDVPTSVTLTTADGTATLADSDYSAVVAQVVSFAAGVTSRTVTVGTNSDVKVESDETLSATLGGLSNGGRTVSLSATNGSATGTILNDDTEVTVRVSPGSVVEDGLAPLVYTFTRIGVVAGTLTANFSVGGSAGLSDYSPLGAATFTASAGSVQFASGSSTAIVSITPNVDSNTELDETVILNVTAGAGYLIGTASSATGTIRDDDAQISLTLAPNNLAEDGTMNLVYTFHRIGSLTDALDVNFDVGGTATFGSDYSAPNATSFTATNGRVTFAPGASSIALLVDPAADNSIEADESVSLSLTAGSGYLPPSQTPVVGMIDNDDFNVSMTVTPDSLAEDAPGTFAYSFSRTGGNNQPLSVRVGVGGTALTGFDYSQTGATSFGSSGAIVTFAPGASTATLLIDPLADSLIESDESVELTLLPGAGYSVIGSASQAVTIVNDDQRVSLSSTMSSVSEDGTANLSVTFLRIGTTNAALSIPFTLGGSASFNSDYVASGDATLSAAGGSLNFAPGATTATLTFDPVVDQELEANEVVLVTLPANPALGVLSPIVAAGAILNDDAIVNVSVTPERVAEEGTNNLVYTFQRFGDTSRAVTVNFSVSGLAEFGTDYTQTGATTFGATSGTVTIPAGAATATVTLDPTADGLLEPNETAVLTVQGGAGYTPSGDPALGTIINQVPTVSLSVSPTQLPENASSNLLYKFTRSGNLSGELTVQFAVSGSATYVADYLQSGANMFSATEGAITFADGASTATLIVDPQIDSVDEQNETVVLSIVPNAEWYGITGSGAATATITDAPMISLAVSPGSVGEDGTPNLLFTFSRGGQTSQALTVNFSVTGSAAFGTDYTQSGAATFSTTAGTVTFPAGSSTKTVTINPTADFTVEADETVVLTVVSGNGYSVAGDNSAAGIIANDDVDIGNVITLDATGRLRITDPSNRDDRLKVVKNSANELVITDSANRLTTTVGRQVSGQEVRVPLSSIRAGTLIVELNGGADQINLSGLPANLLKVTVYGGAGNDTIIGSAGNDTLLGGDGNDSMDGGLGNDGITGDAGNDTINGNNGNDTILGGTGNDYLLGGAGNDRIVGQDGDDRVLGQGGVDRIAGGSGFGRDLGDVVSDLTAEIDEAFRISFDGQKFLLI